MIKAKSLQNRLIIFSIIITTALIIMRLAIMLPTVKSSYVDTYRIGLRPTNDASRWVEYAQEINEKRKIPARPVFPLFLSLPVAIFGTNFEVIAIIFTLLNIAAILTAFYLLKDLKNNIFIVAFLSLISLWRIMRLPEVMTENLAIPVIIIAFALIIKAFLNTSCKHLLSAYILIALAQAIRPWDMQSLLLLPLLAFFLKGVNKKSWKFFISLLAAIILGWGVHFISARVFAEAKGNDFVLAVVLYGQSVGAKGGNAWILDEDLKNVYIKGSSSSEMARLTYQKAWKNIKEKPLNLLKGIIKSYAWLLKGIPKFFSKREIGNWIFFAIMFIVYFLYFFEKKKTLLINPRILSAALALLILLLFDQKIAFSIMIGIGLFSIFVFMQKQYKIIILLYLFSALGTICIFGGSGFERYALSFVLLLFILCAYGMGVYFSLFKNNFKFSRLKGSNYNQRLELKSENFRMPAMAFIVLLTFFIITPLLAQALTKDKGNDINFKVDKEFIQRQLGINHQIISPEDIKSFVVAWPAQPFTKVDRAPVYWKLRYRPFMAFEFQADKGIDVDAYQAHCLWHLAPMPLKRVVYDEDGIIFPNLDKSQLRRFEGDEIIIVGEMIGRIRVIYASRGYCILARLIGYTDNHGNLKWIPVDKL